jgi:hypothetical protein
VARALKSSETAVGKQVRCSPSFLAVRPKWLAVCPAQEDHLGYVLQKGSLQLAQCCKQRAAVFLSPLTVVVRLVWVFLLAVTAAEVELVWVLLLAVIAGGVLCGKG